MSEHCNETPGADLDLASILIEVEPGYVAIEHPDRRQQILLTQAMEGAIGSYAETPNRGAVRLTPGHFKSKNTAPRRRQIGFVQEIAA